MTVSRKTRTLAAGAVCASLAALVPAVAQADPPGQSGDEGAPGIGDPYFPLEGNAEGIDRAQPALVVVDSRSRLSTERSRQRRTEIGSGCQGSRAELGDSRDGKAQVEVLGDGFLDEGRPRAGAIAKVSSSVSSASETVTEIFAFIPASFQISRISILL